MRMVLIKTWVYSPDFPIGRHAPALVRDRLLGHASALFANYCHRNDPCAALVIPRPLGLERDRIRDGCRVRLHTSAGRCREVQGTV